MPKYVSLGGEWVSVAEAEKRKQAQAPQPEVVSEPVVEEKVEEPVKAKRPRRGRRSTKK